MRKTLPPFALSVAGLVVAATLAGPAPAHAECVIEGTAYRALAGRAGDPTGPSLYLKEMPEDDFTYMVRLRDGAFLQAMAGLGQLRVVVRGDTPSCPSEGILRDLGTLVGQPRVIGFADQAQRVD